MERYICIHGHFYQPPRENPWLEAIEIQDSAHPYHNWNERITAECYAPNSAARLLDGDQRIIDIESNYAKISFNYGPTLLSWMESAAPDAYQAILEADRQSRERFSGHGSAIAQAYNHVIMPLANSRDKKTQVLWGIRDFERRFQRAPEGMWLPETAVDLETLNILAEAGIKFTVLAPHQASRIRAVGSEEWKDVSGATVDPTRPYLCRLASGKEIVLCFYDGPISRAVAFERLLTHGEDLRAVSWEDSDERQWPQLLHIATDGETYGHHQKFGDMALAYALHHIETGGLAKLTNYGEHLAKHPPDHEAEIVENTSWSCAHGIERWKSNCGCNSGGHPGWSQEWRAPLRLALDRLRDDLAIRFEEEGRLYLKDPWLARDEYIEVILDRSEENVAAFFRRHAVRELGEEERSKALGLLELQRHALLMYTSCGWFFDELSGIETVQVMQYAARSIQLWKGLSGENLEPGFLDVLKEAKSNVTDHGDGARVYEKFVRPVMVDLMKTAVHYAVSSLFEDYGDRTAIYCYDVLREDYQRTDAGRTKLAVGRASVISGITKKSERVSFAVLHLGNHSLNCGVGAFQGDDQYQAMKQEIGAAFESGDFADVVRLMDKHFGVNNYSIRDLFRDKQRKVLNQLIDSTRDDFETSYRRMYDDSRALMGFLRETGMPLPKAFLAVAEFILNTDMQKTFAEETANLERLKTIVDEMKRWDVAADPVNTEFVVRRHMERMMDRLEGNAGDTVLLRELAEAMVLLQTVPVNVVYWQVQNAYFRIATKAYSEFSSRASAGDAAAQVWVESFTSLGEQLHFNIGEVLKKREAPSFVAHLDPPVQSATGNA
jgi:alpha-amylase/alpha-mannosidase (GH57 family)